MLRLCWVCVLSVALAASTLGFQANRIPGKKLTTAPVIDGSIDDTEWAEAATFEGLVDPNDQKPAAVQSKFWIGYDERYIYFAARNFDPKPQEIRAVEYRTNSSMPGDDSIELRLDLTGSLSDFSRFEVNPRGATNIDLPGGRAAKREWAGEFLGKGRITEEGWEAEMRIPWQVMQLPGSGKRNIRLNIQRDAPRLGKDFVHVYTWQGRQDDTPYWTDVEVPKQVLDRSVKLLPYFYGGYGENEGTVANAGLDLKTQLGGGIALVGTINPDFRNIENQILSLDFSRFERIADESRPFFLEGNEYTDSSIFTSQVIDQFDVGLNAYGKIGNRLSFGMIDTIDFGEVNSFASSFGYQIDSSAEVQAALTSLLRPGLDNTAYMLRYGKAIGSWFFNARSSGSQDSEEGFGADHRFRVSAYRNYVDFQADYTYREPNYYPRLGFFPERDYKGFNSRVGWFRPIDRGPTRFQGISVFGSRFDRINGQSYRDGYGMFGFVTLRNRLGVNVSASHSTFEGQKDEIASAGLSYPDNDPYRRQSVNWTQGKIGGVDYRLLSFGGSFRPFRNLQTNLSHQRSEFMGSREQTIIGANYDLGNDRSISGRMVRSQDDTNWYLALRQSGNLGAEYYLIVGNPNAKRFESSLILKAVFPFDLRLGGRSGGTKRQLSPEAPVGMPE